MGEEKSVLRWGGLAGIIGGILFILTFVVRIAFVGLDPADPAGPIMRFPDVRAALTVEDALYLVTLTLWVTLYLALYSALRETRRTPALFGSVLGILGLVVLAAGSLPHVAFVHISDLYHAPGATPSDKATLVLLWQVTQGTFDAVLIVGLFLVPIGLIFLGAAMLRTPAFGKAFGGTGVALGLAGTAAASYLIVDPLSLIAVVGIFALIVFHLVMGWKLYSLSRT